MKKRYGKTKRGFTLMELLIVVAIIVVLVAISIPIFTKQLEKSRETTDIANMRAAKAAAVTAYLSDSKIGSTQIGDGQSGTATLYYDADKGELKDSAGDINAYGKGTDTVGNKDNTQFGYVPKEAAAKYITVTITDSGNVTMSFNASKTQSTTTGQ